MDFLGLPARVGRGGCLHHAHGQSMSPFWPISRSSHTRPFAELPQRDEIIVRIVGVADSTCVRGKHTFSKRAGRGTRALFRACFVYDYQSNGDPSGRA